MSEPTQPAPERSSSTSSRRTRLGHGVPDRVGEYEVLDVLGQGGMGMVLRARHATLGVERAIKVVRAGAGEHAARRFEREGQNLARVLHPNVVHIHEARWVGGQAYFVMDLVEGQPLDALLKLGRLPLDRALAIAAGVCDGVAALHAAGIIHRDLKPANVIVRPGDQPVVIDLGLAVAPELDQRLTQTGAVMGTVNYMSPEQVDGRRATPASDVWALGLITFELATGRRGVPATAAVPELARRILSEDRPRPSRYDPGLPAALDRLLALALARDEAQRLGSAAELGALLRQLAAAPGPSRRALDRLRAAVVVACLLTLGVGLALGRRLLRGEPAADLPAAPGSRLQPPGDDAAARAEAERRAGEELARIMARQDPDRRLAELEPWLEVWGQHPGAARAREQRRELLRTRPWRALLHEGLRGAAWTAPGELWSWGGDTVTRWDVAGARKLESWTPGPIGGLALLPGEGPAAFLVGLGDGTVLRGRSGESALTPWGRIPPERALTHLEAHPGGRLLLAQTGESQARVLGVEDPGAPPRFELTFPSPLEALGWSRDGRYVLSGCGALLNEGANLAKSPQRAALHDAEDGHLVRELDLFARANGLDLSPDGRTLALATPGLHVHLLDLEAASGPDSQLVPLVGQRGQGMIGGADAVAPAHGLTSRALRFVRGGRRLITSAGDGLLEPGSSVAKMLGELAVWDVSTRRPVWGPVRRAGLSWSVEVEPGEARVAVTFGVTIEVWDVGAIAD